jgi:hypothetical protein
MVHAMGKAGVSSILFVVALLAVGFIAEAQQPAARELGLQLHSIEVSSADKSRVRSKR